MNEIFMLEAIQLAVEMMRLGRGGPFGAVVVKDGEIVGRGWNAVTSTNDPTAHGEVMAIREACRKLGSFRLDGCDLYASCEPCPMCLAAAYWARVGQVYYAASRHDAAEAGFDDEFLHREISRQHSERLLPTRQACRDEALVAFQEWKAKPDKIPY
jgi:tRNA(Arg) A34 adenosine deaminase TadA